jgi:hypothetical protein
MILFGGTGALVSILMLLSVFIQDAERRKIAVQTASGVSLFLVFLLMFFIHTFFGY